MQAPDPQLYADVLLVAMKSALAPVLATLKAQGDQIADLQRRVQDDSLAKALGTLGERVAVVEVKAMQPGPPGEPGKDGKDGADGKPGMEFKGDFKEGQAYGPGDVVAWARSAWICTKSTTVRPDALAAMVKTDDGGVMFNGPNGKDFWRLLVKHGERGRDGYAK